MNQTCMELSAAAEGYRPSSADNSTLHRAWDGFRRVANGAIGYLHLWEERARTRRALMALDDHTLQDIGLGRSEAYREYAKPFWRA